MEEMSSFEKSKLPFLLLLDRATGQAAAYTNIHRLITPLASPELVAFALKNLGSEAAWDESMYVPGSRWRPLPDWATPEVRSRCVIVWIRRGIQDDDYFRSIPHQ